MLILYSFIVFTFYWVFYFFFSCYSSLYFPDFSSVIYIFSDIFCYLFNIVTSTFFFLVYISYSCFLSCSLIILILSSRCIFSVSSYVVSSFFLIVFLIFINSLISLLGLGFFLVLLTLCCIFHCIGPFSVTFL